MKLSKKQLDKKSNIELELEVEDYSQILENFKFFIENYRELVKEFKNSLLKLEQLYIEYNEFFDKNFSFRDVEESKMVFLKSTKKDLIYTKSNEKIFFEKLTNFYDCRKKIFEKFDLIIENDNFGNTLDRAGIKIVESIRDDDLSIEISSLVPSHVFYYGCTFFNFGHVESKYSSEIFGKSFDESQLTEETIQFFDMINTKRIYGSSGTDSNMHLLSLKGLKKNIKVKTSYYENKLRKRELLLRSRKKGKEKMENVGHIYVLSNKSLPPNTYKIGSTYGLPDERAEELTGTGHLTPFKVAYSVKIQRAEYYEKNIHKLLNKWRVKQDREFFELELDKIKDCLNHVLDLSEGGENKIEYKTLENKVKIK